MEEIINKEDEHLRISNIIGIISHTHIYTIISLWLYRRRRKNTCINTLCNLMNTIQYTQEEYRLVNNWHNTLWIIINMMEKWSKSRIKGYLSIFYCEKGGVEERVEESTDLLTHTSYSHLVICSNCRYIRHRVCQWGGVNT